MASIDRFHRSRLFVVAASAIAAVALAAPAQADHLTAGGITLSGKVTSVTAKGIDFQPEFAKTSMTVPWANVQDVSTDARYQVLYGEDMQAAAAIEGYREGHLVIGGSQIDPKSVVSAVAMEAEAPTFMERTRANFRYWHGGADLGLNLQRATTDNLGFLIALHALRAKGPTRLMFGADYRYANERDPDNAPPRTKRTKDAASGAVRGEYDITKNIFAYASTDLLYDAIQNLSLRAVPKAGAGYVVWQREPKEGLRDFLSVDLGAGWVYQKYIDNQPDLTQPPNPDDDYFTIALGASAAYLLPRGMALDWRFDYLPSVTDFSVYVVRTTAGLTVPLIAPVSARMSIADTYDSNPSANTDKNALLFDTTLSVGW
ncbi:MAG TPA: DUF481 domain-containing protein [Candidatus Binatia bacterium]|jgi:hypothetical protein